MFLINKIICAALVLFSMLSLAGCKNQGTELGYVESGELVVIEDTSNIKLGIYGIDTLNPIATKSESVRDIMNIVYDSLFTLDEEQQVVPELAQSYELSGDGRSIAVTLKDGVKWHNGTNFTASDVVFTLSKLRTAGGLYSKISEKISSYTAAEKNKVIIEFAEPCADPAYLLTFPIMPESAPYSQDQNFVPMGTGSYKFSSKSGTEIVLEPNSLWYGGTPSEKWISVKILKDKDAMSEAFNVKELDAITYGGIDVETAAPKMTSVSETMISQNMVFLGFNAAGQHLSSASVRSAIGGFLDKEKILETDAYGLGMVSDLPINPTSWVYRKLEKRELPDGYSERLLAGDGYVMKGGVYYKNDIPLNVRILVNNENERRVAIAESVAAALRASGFGVTVESIPYSQYSAKIAADDFDMFVGEVLLDNTPNPAEMLTSWDNYFNLDIAPIAESMTKLYGVTDKDELVSNITEVARRFYGDMPYIPLYFKAESVVYGSYVSGIEKPVVFDPYKGIEKWYFYDKDGKESKGKGDE